MKFKSYINLLNPLAKKGNWKWLLDQGGRLFLCGAPQSNLDILGALSKEGKWSELIDRGRKLLLVKEPLREDIEFIVYSLQQGGQLEGVSEIGFSATKLFPRYWIFPFLTGYALRNLGRAAEAVKYLRLAHSINPKDLQTIKELIKAIVEIDGIDVAASKYATLKKLNFGDSTGVELAQMMSTIDWASKVGLEVLDAGDIEEIPFITPKILGKASSGEIKFESSNKPYVADLNNVRIFSKSSVILTSDGTALSDTGGDKNFGEIVNFCYEKIIVARQAEKVLLDSEGFTVGEIEAGIFLSGLASDAFGHWLPEFLPKLESLMKHPEYHNFPIIVDAGMPQSHFDHLKRLTNNSLILLQPNESLFCRRLLVSPSPTFFPVETFPNDLRVNKLSVLSPRALKFVRANDFSQVTSRPNQRKIFLRRKNRSWRRLINEEEIAANLRSIGFEDIFAEEMTAGEQIDLFRQAKCIVAPNGSALLNLIFANTDTKVLILIQHNLHNYVTLQSPLEAMGYEILAVCGDYAVSDNQKHSDFSVPMPRIYEALSKLGIK